MNDLWRNYENKAKSGKELEKILAKKIEHELQMATSGNVNFLSLLF